MWQVQRQLEECENDKTDLQEKCESKKFKRENEEQQIKDAREEAKGIFSKGQELEVEITDLKETLDTQKEEMIKTRGSTRRIEEKIEVRKERLRGYQKELSMGETNLTK